MTTKKSTSNHTDIRVGIADSSQELNIESELAQDAVLKIVKEAIEKNEALVLEDTKGRKTIIHSSKISFVEVGESAERRVGFATL